MDIYVSGVLCRKWVEPVAVSQQCRAQLSQKNVLPSPAETSEGETDLFSQSQTGVPSVSSHLLLRLCPQVNLIPELMDAFSDVGGGLCLLFARLDLTGE